MRVESRLTQKLRESIVGKLHLGLLHTGDRLPSIREVAEAEGANPRTVAKAYRTLETEGLVEIRERGGVYVAHQERLGGKFLSETARWMIEVLVQARRRQIDVPAFHDLVRRCTALVKVRCACVEVTIDAMAAYVRELEEAWGFQVEQIYLDLPAGTQDERLSEAREAELKERFEHVDVVATSALLAPVLRSIALAAEKPLAVLTLHPEITEAVRRKLQTGRITIVGVDPRFAERFRRTFVPGPGTHLEFIRARERAAVAALDSGEPALVTAAARDLLGDAAPPALSAPSPLLSPETERELAEVVVEVNRRAWE